MRGAGGALAVAVAALLVCCSADSHQESEAGSEHTAERYEPVAVGGDPNHTEAYQDYLRYLLTYLNDFGVRNRGGSSAMVDRNIFDGSVDKNPGGFTNTYQGHKPADLEHPEGSFKRQVREAGQYGFVPYLMTRRFDYISPYGGKREPWAMAYGGYYGDGFPKRNFDEIDRSSLDTFVRKRNFDEIDQSSMPFPYSKRFYRPASFDKKRYRPDYPMDEIDLSQFPVGSKRTQDILQPQH